MKLFDKLVRHGMPFVPKPVVRQVARRYVAGEEVADAVRTIRELNAEGAMATVDVLGEEVTDPRAATAAVEQYLELLATIDREGLDANVSIKPTMLGLKVDEAMCLDNVRRIVARAAELDNFVRIDMEDHTCTDATLRIHRTLAGELGHVGVVLQSYLHRTMDDAVGLLPLGPNIRLCKGIYREPRAIAWTLYETVRANFIAVMDRLLEGGAYVGIATHDAHLVWAGMTTVHRLGLAPDAYEFQMLLGVDPELRRIILERGHRLRVYVPFGRDWYPYSMRRLRENPTVAHHVTRAMLGLGPR
ncbi:MAG TPA: proline dehydrogenase family protein [Candidatus Sulfomarinibacteraceae bacterium]|nr:proline dehydrogenase family protein [Candidatus Sulfomarinibacteraceae bacterium]